MKLTRLTIKNFKQIARLEVNLCDSLGRPRDLIMLAGPNMSGKTTVLDAITAAIGIAGNLFMPRQGFNLHPQLVRRGELQAEVTCWLRFSAAELEAARQALKLLSRDRADELNGEDVKITWRYPDVRNQFPNGRIQVLPTATRSLVLARRHVADLLRGGTVGIDWFERAGGVFCFDQQRTGMGKTIPRDIWAILNPEGTSTKDEDDRYTTDPRTILLSLAVRSKFPAAPDTSEVSDFSRIQQWYGQVCTPHRLIGAVRTATELDLEFSDGQASYRFDGLSSGEQMLLLYMIRMVTEHVHRSIVLIDELELHLRPAWQLKLLSLLPKIGLDNQIIATTHSPYLRDAMPRDALIDLGDLSVPVEESDRG